MSDFNSRFMMSHTTGADQQLAFKALVDSGNDPVEAILSLQKAMSTQNSRSGTPTRASPHVTFVAGTVNSERLIDVPLAPDMSGRSSGRISPEFAKRLAEHNRLQDLVIEMEKTQRLMQDKIDGLTRTLHERDDTISRLKIQHKSQKEFEDVVETLAHARHDTATLEAKFQTANSQFLLTNSENAKLKSRVLELESALTTTTQQLERLVQTESELQSVRIIYDNEKSSHEMTKRTLDTARGDIARLESEVAQAQARYQSILEEQGKHKNSEESLLYALQEERKQHQTTSQLRSETVERERHLVKLVEELQDQLRGELEKQRDSNRDRANQLLEARNEVEKAQERADEIQQDAARFRKDAERLRSELQVLSSTNENFEARISELQQLSHNQNSEINRLKPLEHKVTLLGEEIATASEKLQLRDAEIVRQKAEIEKHKQRIQTIVSECDSVHEQLRSKSADLDRARTETSRQQQRVNTIVEQRDQCQSEIHTLTADNDKLRAEVGRLRDKISEQTRDTEILKDNNRERSTEISRLGVENEKLRSIESEYHSLESQLHSAAAERHTAAQQIAEQNVTITRLRTENERVRAREETSSSQLRAAESESASLRVEIDKLKHQISTLQHEREQTVSLLNTQHTTQQQEILILRSECTAKEGLISKLQKSLSEKNITDASGDDVQSLIAHSHQVTSLQQQIKALQSEISHLRDQVATRGDDDDLDKLRAENEALRAFENKVSPHLFLLNELLKMPEHIGVGIYMESDSNKCEVKSLVEGWSAEKSGAVCVGDVIVSVDGNSTANLDASSVRDMILGRRGSYVTIVLERSGVVFEVKLKRGYFGPEHAVSFPLEEKLVTTSNLISSNTSSLSHTLSSSTPVYSTLPPAPSLSLVSTSSFPVSSNSNSLVPYPARSIRTQLPPYYTSSATPGRSSPSVYGSFQQDRSYTGESRIL